MNIYEMAFGYLSILFNCNKTFFERLQFGDPYILSSADVFQNYNSVKRTNCLQRSFADDQILR